MNSKAFTSKKRVGAVMAVVILFGGVAYQFRAGHSPSHSFEDSRGAINQLGALSSHSSESQNEPGGADASANAIADPSANMNAQGVALESSNDVYKSELADLARLRAKVFLSEDEKAERTRLLADRDFLRGVGIFVRKPATALDEQKSQAGALDTLIEALDSSARDVAAGELKELAADDRIEDATLDSAARKNLAGLKAEALFKWTAHEPSVSDEIQRLLPGPVSRKIWENVLAEQEQNAAESRTLAREIPH